jgi:acetolactate synthase-1/2/3 large subunit
MAERPTLFSGTSARTQQLSGHGGKRVAWALRDHGVDTVFTLCGGHVLPILDGCLDAGIRVVDARHEGAAVMMAEAYATATRRPAVCAVTAGPGFTNAVTGIANANHSGVPLVVLGGRTPLKSWNRGAIQDVDQLGIARIISKHATLCLEAARLEEYVADAFWHASAPRSGVAYVELPTDLLLTDEMQRPDWSPGFPADVAGARAAPAAADELVGILARAERPVVVCGSGPFWGRADTALASFAEKTGIPVTTTGPARGLLPDSHPGCLGSLVHGGVAAALADVVVVCGSRFDGNMIFGGPPLFSPHQKIVQIDVRADAFGGNRAPDLAVLGDAATVLAQVTETWTRRVNAQWLEEARGYAESSRSAWNAECDEAVDGVHPGLLAREISQAAHARGSATLVADGGDVLTWAIAQFRAEQPGGLLTTGTALGTLGVGVPFAVGAKAARPNDAVVCLSGDGAFGLCAMELDTAARHGLPIVVVVSNNSAWADVRHEQQAWFGDDRLVASGLAPIPYEKLGEMVGGHGAFVERPEDVRPAVEAALDAGTIAVVNVRTDPTVVSEVLRGIGQLGVM